MVVFLLKNTHLLIWNSSSNKNECQSSSIEVVTDLIWRHAFAFDGGTFTFHSVSVSWRDFFSMPGIEDIPHLVLKICYPTDGHFKPA